jgi:hypothetical protein
LNIDFTHKKDGMGFAIISLMENQTVATKIQMTFFDIRGSIYKQGFYATDKTAMQAYHRTNREYGGSLRTDRKIVPKTQKHYEQVSPIGNQYCFCPNTPLSANRCGTCGKSPYTD